MAFRVLLKGSYYGGLTAKPPIAVSCVTFLVSLLGGGGFGMGKTWYKFLKQNKIARDTK